MVVDNMPKWMSHELVILLLANPSVLLTFTQSLIWIVAGLSLSIFFSILWCYFLLWGANIVLRQTKFKIDKIAHTACVYFHWVFDTVYTCFHWFFDKENLTQVSFRLVCIVFYAMVMLIMEPSPPTLLAIICAHCMAVTGCILWIGFSFCAFIRKNFLANFWKVQWLISNGYDDDCDYESHDVFNELMMVMVMIMIVMIEMVVIITLMLLMILLIMTLLMILMTVMIRMIMAMISVCRSGAISPRCATDSAIAIRVADDGSVFFYGRH